MTEIRRSPPLSSVPPTRAEPQGDPGALPAEREQRDPHWLELKDLRRIADGELTVEVGDKGPAIKELQKALGETVTGTYDVETAAAVARFQQKNGLDATGFIDGDTLFGLNETFEKIHDRFERYLQTDTKDAFAEIQEAVEEGTGLQAHKKVIIAEEIALGVATTRNALEALGKAGQALRPNALSIAGDVVGVVLLPATAYYATKDVRAALSARRDGDETEIARERSAAAVNRAFGSVGYFTSVAATTAKEILQVSMHATSFAGRVVPGLSVIVAAGDVTWATTVVRDKDVSLSKKTAACASAIGSLVSMVSPPPISWAASAVATGGLLATNFL
jgi:peptidoglycan hydrolase-like protein with peptidoglycan-binding domain